jgi:hypothetical protein
MRRDNPEGRMKYCRKYEIKTLWNSVTRWIILFEGLNILISTFCVCADGFQVSLTMAIHGFIIGHSWIALTTCCELQSFPVYGHIWIPLLATPGLAIPPAESCRIPLKLAVHGSLYWPLLDWPYHLL